MNLANKITLLRIILIPLFLFFIYSDIEYNMLIATIVFVIASITDYLDGYIARSRNEVTNFGKFLDPLADKLMVTAAFISLVELGRIEGWIIFIIMAREFAITGFRAVAASDGLVIAASIWGKIKTVTQIIAIILALLNIPYYNIIVIIALIATILSGVDYIYKNKNVLNTNVYILLLGI